MMNYFMLMGKIVDISVGNTLLELEVTKPYNNGKITGTDKFLIVLHEKIREYVKDYITIGNRVGVKGRIDYDDDNNLILLATELIGLHTFNLENE